MNKTTPIPESHALNLITEGARKTNQALTKIMATTLGISTPVKQPHHDDIRRKPIPRWPGRRSYIRR